ncbi:MAG TPA: DUF4153 domain-containing protein, partial [Longimicrobiales bacterium]|nr:DUF4153 domain-containing protein [Longimicrobiales bacterium]
MNRSLFARARGYLVDAAHALERAPVEVALALFATVTFSWAIELRGDGLQHWIELAVAVALAFCAAWSATLLHGLGRISSRQRFTITVLGAFAAAAYGLVVIDFDRNTEVWRAFVILAGAVALTAAVPSLVPNADRNYALRRIDGRILLRLFGVGIYALALFAGLALALGAVDQLFELDLDESIYGHVFGWLMFGLVPWVVVGGLPDYVAPLERESPVNPIAYRLTLFLLQPLLALYMVILYAYAVRIGVTGEVPKNLVSPMVIAAGLLGAAAIMLVDPRPDEPSPLRYLRLAPLVFLPLGVLGLWALAPRIRQYGWTEFRLLRTEGLVALCLLAIAGTVLLWRRRIFPLRAILFTLAFTALIGAVGPWSAMAVARRSQQTRLLAGLRAAEIDPAAPRAAGDTTARTVTREVYEQVDGTARYLRDHFGSAAVTAVLPREARAEFAAGNLAEHYGVRPAQPVGREAFRNLRLGEGAALRTDQGVTVYRINLPPTAEADVFPRAHSVANQLRIVFPRQTLFIPRDDIL